MVRSANLHGEAWRILRTAWGLAALLAPHEVADGLYEKAAATPFTAEELGVRT